MVIVVGGCEHNGDGRRHVVPQRLSKLITDCSSEIHKPDYYSCVSCKFDLSYMDQLSMYVYTMCADRPLSLLMYHSVL